VAGTRGTTGAMGLGALVGAMWAASIWTCFLRVSSPVHGVLDSAATAVTVCAYLYARRGSPRLKPGERIVSDAEYHATEAALTRAILAGQPERGGSADRHIRSAS